MKATIGIVGWGSLSALGSHKEQIWKKYQEANHVLQQGKPQREWWGKIPSAEEQQLEELRLSQKNYRQLDRSVLLAILAAQRAARDAGWPPHHPAGVNIGSSRGATEITERRHEDFLQKTSSVLPSTSPLSTLGNLSYWVANHLDLEGIPISHSITCSTAMHSLFNAVAWLKAGMSKYFLAGGSEAPLTAFTLAQMKALKIYASAEAADFPCRALAENKEENTMVLGEGAACFCLERSPAEAMAWIRGMGYGREPIRHAAALSKDGQCLQQAMRQALGELAPSAVDLIITHAPGTVGGDAAERAAVRQVFGENIPLLSNNKWKIGHTLGASAALSIEMALLMLQHQEAISVPYLTGSALPKRPLRNILINALGFGAQASSILISGVEAEI
ncbi:MAG: beta-ketoacyl synthase N-terminal-like domain-containing protein [Bacteroidota bacterium]